MRNYLEFEVLNKQQTSLLNYGVKKQNLEHQLLRKERVFKLEKVSEETLGKKQFSAVSKQYESNVLNWAREMI